MIPTDLIKLHDNADEPPPVTVIANDYRYDGWLIAVFSKRRSGDTRCVIEDDFGRLFIHNAAQIRKR